ncbi:amidohydrolase family protein [Coraliomargarita akajimensis]|uniref:Amidohydrolase 2 n=1 Tax=Coraliomargarita akajimensis (strain DSM 45221 / IAM 15411 / JCM 23193 / KCTC 12865 / 04OKA010-24) TaxID=583355 RepID=D5ELS4_CORAD|nr:amidohydrolase family protein [Coraliomargarita akajimensis]ADE53249.1 amidohydrolase 2 [Coraliomargarita akajimensis DSM 45221]
MSIPILDTHQHLVLAKHWPYSWTNDIPALAGKVFDYEAYLKAIEGTGIASTLFMETTPDDPHWLEEAKVVDGFSREEGSLIQGLIANCRPEEGGFDDYLASLEGYRVHGLRRFLHAAPEGTADSSHFVPNLRRLALREWTFDLCVFEHQLQLAERLARACPEVQFILDHCGVPAINGGNYKDWANAIRDLSKVDNVACKLSGVLAYCPEGEATTERVRPYVEHCIECFDWDRVVWGSDWPVVTITSSLQYWVASTRELIAKEDPGNQAKLLHRNAERIYNLNPIQYND